VKALTGDRDRAFEGREERQESPKNEREHLSALRTDILEVVMNRIIFVPALAISFLLPAHLAGAQDKASQAFLSKAIEGNYAEVEMGKLAQKNGASDAVKSFGKMLETDHADAAQKASQVAQSLNVTPPTGPNKQQKADYDKMAKMSGAAFDKMFAEHMVKDHKKDIGAYQKAAKAKDAAGQYAGNTLPTLQKHLETAQSIQKQKTSAR
jgi:putative membrane protein